MHRSNLLSAASKLQPKAVAGPNLRTDATPRTGDPPAVDLQLSSDQSRPTVSKSGEQSRSSIIVPNRRTGTSLECLPELDEAPPVPSGERAPSAPGDLHSESSGVSGQTPTDLLLSTPADLLLPTPAAAAPAAVPSTPLEDGKPAELLVLTAEKVATFVKRMLAGTTTGTTGTYSETHACR